MDNLISVLSNIMSPDLTLLGKEGTKEIIKELVKKIDSSKFKALSLDEYNALKENIDPEAFYFIVDKDDEIFNKVQELYNIIDDLKKQVEEAKQFKDMFPVDNRTYGIINQQPKNLSEVFPDELGIPTDQTNLDLPIEEAPYLEI